MKSQTPFDLQKLVWKDSDFENMSWHDCRIHAMSFNPDNELSFDIDYITQWVLKGKTYKFWIAPATIVFENVYDFVLENSSMDFIIDEIVREDKGKPANADYIGRDKEFAWSIQLISGSISFCSVGFKQYMRKKPIFQSADYLMLDARGGISFERAFEN